MSGQVDDAEQEVKLPINRQCVGIKVIKILYSMIHGLVAVRNFRELAG